MFVSIVVGGTRGMGAAIAEKLKERGDVVYTVPRSRVDSDKHISVDLLDIKKVELEFSRFKGINTVRNLIFSQRRRPSDDLDSEVSVMLKSTKVVIESLIPCFAE